MPRLIVMVPVPSGWDADFGILRQFACVDPALSTLRAPWYGAIAHTLQGLRGFFAPNVAPPFCAELVMGADGPPWVGLGPLVIAVFADFWCDTPSRTSAHHRATAAHAGRVFVR